MGKEQSKEMQEQNDLIRKLPNAQAQATKDAMESVLAKSGVKDGKISDPTQREQVAKAVEGHNKDLFMKDVDVDKIKKEAAAKIRAGDITGGLSLLENSLRREARFKGGEDGHVNVNELDELAKK